MTEVTLEQADDGRRVELSVGHTVLVRLPENPSTGYLWAVERVDAAVLALESAEFTESSQAAMGSPGVRTFRFTVVAAGETELALKQWREWQGDNSIVERFAVTVHVLA